MQHGNPTYKKDRDSHRAPTNVDIDELPVQEISDRKRSDGSVAAARSTSTGVGVGECDSDSFSARSRLSTTSYGHALCVPDRPNERRQSRTSRCCSRGVHRMSWVIAISVITCRMAGYVVPSTTGISSGGACSILSAIDCRTVASSRASVVVISS